MPARRLTSTGYLGFVVIGWNAVLIASLIRSLESIFHLSDASFALFYFLSSLLYAAGAFSGGLLVERVGRRLVLPVGALVLAIGLAGEALSTHWVLFILLALPVNWGAGVLDGGINGLFLDLYPSTRGGALNLLHAFFSIGALASPFVAGMLLGHGVTWRVPLLVTAVGALLLAALLASAGMPAGQIPTAVARDAAAESRDGASLIPFAGLAVSIGLYVAVEIGVSSWLVRLLAGLPIATATGVLSLFWGGLTLGRLLSNRVADRLEYATFIVIAIVFASISLAGALLAPWLVVQVICFALTGFFLGPIYPTIVAFGGMLYPQRIAALSGSLAAAAVVGSLVYPPLIGVTAAAIGIRGGLIGAVLLGLPESGGIVLARTVARREVRSAEPA